MMTGRVASRATSNDFYDLAGREMMKYETRPSPSSQPKSWTNQTGSPKGRVFIGMILPITNYRLIGIVDTFC